MADSRYRITERVAAGGMAEVFRGVAESLQGFRKNIAIKRILPALTQNKKFVAMFLDEARLSLSLQHANIVQVFDIGHSEDTYFIVMEYVDGVDLKGLIEWRRRLGKRLPIAAALYLINEICKGLGYAHDLVSPETGKPLGIVHRDISPPNVLISKQGEVKVVDFGLAKATSQIETTDPGVVKGKMSYLSPEAARGEDVDSRADIFSVGIILYELLTGKRLFYGETDYQTVELVRNARVPPIKAQNPGVEQELEDVVRRALARRKEDRFQNATDLQDALAQYSYSRGLKVIARDISELVRQCLEDKAAESGGKQRRAGNILDTLLQDEINKFTSVDFEDPGAKPVSPEELAASGSGGEFVDPRAWAKETTNQPLVDGRRPTGSVPLDGPIASLFDESRPTLRDDGAISAQAAVALQAVGTSGRRTPSVPDAALAGPTPGPEALASVLEPTPSPAARPKGAPPLSAVRANKLLMGMLIGLVVLAVAVTAAVLAKRQSVKRAARHASASATRLPASGEKPGQPGVRPLGPTGQPQLEMLAAPKQVQAFQQPVRARPNQPKIPRPRARRRPRPADNGAPAAAEAEEEADTSADDPATEASEAAEGQ
jgi:serine/threonine protein kinase